MEPRTGKIDAMGKFYFCLYALCNLETSTLIRFLTSYYVFNDLFCVYHPNELSEVEIFAF